MNHPLATAMIIGSMLNDGLPSDNINTLHNSPVHEHHPWDKISLSKSERKGKTFEEMQKIRKEKYERVYSIGKEE